MDFSATIKKKVLIFLLNSGQVGKEGQDGQGFLILNEETKIKFSFNFKKLRVENLSNLTCTGSR